MVILGAVRGVLPAIERARSRWSPGACWSRPAVLVCPRAGSRARCPPGPCSATSRATGKIG